jgi:hypothetical protein
MANRFPRPKLDTALAEMSDRLVPRHSDFDSLDVTG